MLRIANPGSDLGTFVRVFRGLYSELSGLRSFGLDDMSRAMVKLNLLTSSGYMGAEALERGYRDDRSRDGPFNQSKMYSELFRMLGWVHPLLESRGEFRFTYLGAHVAAARTDTSKILEESLLGIAFPNPFVQAKARVDLRPFAAMLRAIAELDGIITRDELIVGPLCLSNDRDASEWATMIATIRKARGSQARLATLLEKVSKERKITLVTMRNYTRFPLAALQGAEWTEKVVLKEVYGSRMVFLRLTEKGAKVVERVGADVDIRASDLAGAGGELIDACVRTGFFGMMARAGFEIGPVAADLTRDRAVLARAGKSDRILFSPFQELDLATLTAYFPDVRGDQERAGAPAVRERAAIAAPVVTLLPLVLGGGEEESNEEIALEIEQMHERGLAETEISEHLCAVYSRVNGDVFYPLIASLFRVIGYDCETSRRGVNYQRYDALILDGPDEAIPVEIKSPGEEEYLSVKGVRQALENKVILMGRKSFPASLETTSLVVGYKLPNDRAEVMRLVEDVERAFGVRIGVLDLESLLRLAIMRVVRGVYPDRAAFRASLGIIEVKDATT